MEIDMSKIDADNSMTITITGEATEVSFGTSCLVCDEYIPLHSYFDHGPKICEKCKGAILKMREYMKED